MRRMRVVWRVWGLGTWCASAWFLMACALDSNGMALPALVGEPCEIHQVPEHGFNSNEVYMETDHPGCASQRCVVDRLNGDPRHVCDPEMTSGCIPQAVVDHHIFCTCRCDGAPSGIEVCTCPEGMVCEVLFELGGPNVEGSYCTRDRER